MKRENCKPSGDTGLSCQKSAEVIVVTASVAKDRTLNGLISAKFRGNEQESRNTLEMGGLPGRKYVGNKG